MKKIFFILLSVLIAMSLFAQEVGEGEEVELKPSIDLAKDLGFTLSGEAKSGIFWRRDEQPGLVTKDEVRFHNNDDAGNFQARFRLNLDYLNQKVNLGFKVRLQWDDFGHERMGPIWPYAFGYGNFFKNNLSMSIGKLGASPWGTGGPEMWKELEQMDNNVGMRLEFTPQFYPEKYGRLNVGFVLNYFDGYMDGRNTDEKPITFLDFLLESVIGASYTHKYFLARVAFRLDSDVDMRGRDGVAGIEGAEMVYRVEERIIKEYLKGFQIWMLGHLAGLGAENESYHIFKNWLFVEYAPDFCKAQIRFGYDTTGKRSIFYLKPSFGWNFLNGLLVPSVLFGIGWDFGTKVNDASPFSFMELEPKLTINFTEGAYIVFAYNWRREYKQPLPTNSLPMAQTQWINLRMGLRF